MSARPAQSFLLGIDLVEIKKARVFYREHQNRLSSFFSPREVAYIHRGKRPAVNLARILAAKEAAFKAARQSAAGPSLFRDIRVVPKSGGFFSCRVSATHRSYPSVLKISFFQDRKIVVAKCVGTC